MVIYLVPDGKGNQYMYQFVKIDWSAVVGDETVKHFTTDILDYCFIE
jgi:hypothetical protein